MNDNVARQGAPRTNAVSRARLGVRRCAWALGVLLGLGLGSSAVAHVEAQSVLQRLSLRTTGGVSLMLPKDQRTWLRFASSGLLSDLQLQLDVTPLVAAQVGVLGGVFFSSIENGAVVAPMLGATARWPLGTFTPFLAVNAGAAFTGPLIRPFARALVGLDVRTSRTLSIAPVLGLDVVTQRDLPQYSSDAVYAWLGLSLAFHPQGSAAPPVRSRPVAPPPKAAEPELAPLPAEPWVPPSPHEPAPPSSELRLLLDEAVNIARSELLAPVLFEFDSVTLEPSSVAMLHEVARVLNEERADIQRLAIIAYADVRGSAQYNRELAQRRAQSVRDWLVEHGVAPARLATEGRGAVELIEPGEQETAHQQNRRVIFRVLQTKGQP